MTLASHAVRLPAVVGFLLTGVLIGPHGLAWVTDETLVEAFAEIGVVFLLFSIGLEFSVQRLRQIGRAFVIGGGLQTVLTILIVLGVFLAVGVAVREAVFYGFLVALSSTAIILKLYADRQELDAPHGKILIGILLFQDLLLVPLIILTPLLAGDTRISTTSILLRLGIGLVVVGVVFLVSRTLMPKVLYAMVRTRVREILVLGSLLAALGLALTTAAFGFSLALGAFLAGILIAESDYSHQVVAEMSPFRDVFTSLFFISIGMLLDLEFAATRLPLIALILGASIALKTVVAAAAAAALRFPARTVTLVALSLAQIGEFSFVLGQVGLENGLLPGDRYQIFLAVAVFSMMLTPFLIRAAPALAARLTGNAVADGGGEVVLPEAVGLQRHVVIVGFGINGRNLARVLKRVQVPYVVLELNPDVVREAKTQGEPIIFGDSTRADVLRSCGIGRATIIVFGISDLPAVLRSVRLSRELNPSLSIVVRTRQVADIDALVRAGADDVVAEEFETSIEIFTRVLERLHVPPNVIEAQAKILRVDAYRSLRGSLGAGRFTETVLEVLEQGTTSVFHVGSETAAAGRSMAELDLRRRTGATVIAIVRDGVSNASPTPDVVVEVGDDLVLVGDHVAVREAFGVLQGKKPEAPPAPAQAPVGTS